MKFSITRKKKSTTSREFVKFLLLLFILLSYTAFLSYKYDFRTGGIASVLSWSFFVLCTPIADAGFLLDFPLRLLFGVRMVVSEIYVWGLAIGLNVFFLYQAPYQYNTTELTKIFHHILTTPYPYWFIIVLSFLGTFLSLFLGDYSLDFWNLKSKGRKKQERVKYLHKILPMVFIFMSIVILYIFLMKKMGITVEQWS